MEILTDMALCMEGKEATVLFRDAYSDAEDEMEHLYNVADLQLGCQLELSNQIYLLLSMDRTETPLKLLFQFRTFKIAFMFLMSLDISLKN